MTPQQILCVKQALTAIEQREMQAFEQLNDPIPPFSERFERKMEKLFRSKQAWTWQLTKTPKRRLLSVILAIILLSVLTVSVSAVGKSIYPFIVSFWKDHVSLQMFENEHRTEITQHYSLGELPENYKLQKNEQYETLHITKWTYGDKYISLKQATTENVSIHISMNEDTCQYITLRGMELMYIRNHGYYSFIWEEDGYSFTFLCPDEISWEDTVRMIESIHPTESLPITQGGK